MRYILALLVAAAVVGGFLRFNKQSEAPAAGPKVSILGTQAAAAPPVDGASQHHWPKRALDRAADVKRQVSDQRKVNELP